MKLPGTFSNSENQINVIIETPKGSRNKFVYDEATGLFKLGKILPAGTVFPHHFGFIPSTKGGDGDPLDVLAIMEIPTFPGNLLECRLIGVLEAEQKDQSNKVYRNDRLIAIPVESHDFAHIKSLKHLEKNMIRELISFFKYYNAAAGKKFKVLRIRGPKTALALVQQQMV